MSLEIGEGTGTVSRVSTPELFAFLVGEAVEQVWVWGPIRLVLDLGALPERGIYVDVYRCSYTEANGVTAEIDASEAPREAGSMLALLGDA